MKENVLKNIRILIECVYLTVLALLVTYAFLRTTIWPLPWAAFDSGIQYFNELSSAIPLCMDYVLAGIILLRCLTMGKKGLGYLCLSAGLCAVVFHAYGISQNRELLYLVLLILGAKDISFKKIMKVYTVVVGVLLSATVAAAAVGILENVSFSADGKLAFGIVSSTDFAAHVFFAILCVWYVWGEKTKIWAAVPVLGAAVLIYRYSQARCSTACLILLAVLLVGHILVKRFAKEKGRKYAMQPVLACILGCSVQLAAVGTLVLTMMYQFDIPWLYKVDQIMSNRLELGKRGLDICGFSLWGQSVELRGNWVTGAVTGKYFYLDSSYLQMTIMYGMIISVLLMFAFLMIGYRAYGSRQWILLLALGLLAIHGVIEQRLWSIAYCPFLLAVFARLDKKQEGSI